MLESQRHFYSHPADGVNCLSLSTEVLSTRVLLAHVHQLGSSVLLLQGPRVGQMQADAGQAPGTPPSQLKHYFHVSSCHSYGFHGNSSALSSNIWKDSLSLSSPPKHDTVGDFSLPVTLCPVHVKLVVAAFILVDK